MTRSRLLFSKFSKKLHQNQSKGLASLELSPAGVSFSYLEYDNSPSMRPQLKFCDFFTCEDRNQLHNCLLNLMTKFDLADTDFNWVLHPNDYRLLLVDAPNVPINEQRAAVRWQVRDLIDFPIEEVVVEVFNLPEGFDEYRKKVYAVVAHSTFLQEIVALFKSCKINLLAIDIREFALRNLLTAYTNQIMAQVVLDFSSEYCLLMIVRDNCIDLVRRISVGLKALEKEDGILSFIFELKRSFDYYETELKQTLPEKIFFTPVLPADKNIIDAIVARLPMPSEHLDLNKLSLDFIPLGQEQQAHSYVTIGGALRSKEDK
jgi:MSHA biogenesis protein MshI